ncbi:MAG: metalloregulator ArsR/SmtB family transcription factor [bacterium]|nr:metalloregulator ArsR/SmtB family transcription factor [bacterium]
MKPLERAFKSLGDATRLRILKMLEVRPLCNCEIQEILKLAPSTVSKHLGLLRTAGFVEDERQGKWVIYRLVEQPEDPMILSLRSLLQSWGGDQEQIKQDQEAARSTQGRYQCGD